VGFALLCVPPLLQLSARDPRLLFEFWPFAQIMKASSGVEDVKAPGRTLPRTAVAPCQVP
jgi:hypothetical protein